MNYTRAATRYWWLILLGLAVACLTGILLLYHVERFWPPQLASRATPQYIASTELLVDSPGGPYLRTTTRQATPALRSLRTGRGSGTPSSSSEAPVTETKQLIDAANLFPLFVESDAVYQIRRKLVGDIPGFVRAKALYALQGERRFRPSEIPVMQIIATAANEKSAITLTQGTARAFQLWLARQQERAGVPPNQRIIVRELHVPRSAGATGGPAYGLPALASFGVLALFIALAGLLDQARTRSRAAAELRPVPAGQDAAEAAEHRGLAVSGGRPESR